MLSLCRTASVVLALCLAATGVASAQRAYLDLLAEHGRPPVYHEAVVLPGADSAAVSIVFRVPNPLLVFVRDGASEQPYRARPRVVVEVLRYDDVVASRRWQGEQHAETFAETQRAELDVLGRVDLRLPPGRYAYRLALGHGADEAADVLPAVPLTVPSRRGPGIGRAVPVRADAPGTMLAVGGQLELTQEAGLAIPVWLGAEAEALPDGAALHWAVHAEVRVARKHPLPFLRAAFAPAAAWSEAPIASGRLEADAFYAVAPTGQVVAPADLPVEAARRAAGLFLGYLDPPETMREDGRYRIEMRLDGVPDGPVEHATILTTEWRGRPVALYDPDVAIDMLTFIEARDVVESMRRLGPQARTQALADYWAARDPSPGTRHNELRAEYYRRVDEAAVLFRTGAQPVPDGLETDRARIYVRYGPASEVERRLVADGVQEVWTYADGRRFVFFAASSLDAFVLLK